MDGFDVLECINLFVLEIFVIMIFGYVDIDMVVEMVKKGVFDFISKLLDLNCLFIMLCNVLDKLMLIGEKKVL